jgi:hypothetical protein
VTRTAFLKGSPSWVLLVVSETIIELDDPDGHEPDLTLGNPAVPINVFWNGYMAGSISAMANELFVIFRLPDITSHLDEKVCGLFLTNRRGIT